MILWGKYMKCPKCDHEMNEGFIPVYRGVLHWLPKNQNLPLILVKHPKNGVVLSDYAFWDVKKAVSYYCESCEIVITPVKK